MKQSSNEGARLRGWRRPATAIIAGVVALGVVAGYVLQELYRARPMDSKNRVQTSEDTASQPDPAPWRTVGGTPAENPSQPQPAVKYSAPWESTPENTPSAGAGFIPAYKVNPPRPPTFAAPPAPTEPPNPATARPQMENPGGANGDRPARQ